MKNPTWQRDELILALDLYFQLEPGQIHGRNPQVEELSELLNQLPIHARELRKWGIRRTGSEYPQFKFSRNRRMISSDSSGAIIIGRIKNSNSFPILINSFPNWIAFLKKSASILSFSSR